MAEEPQNITFRSKWQQKWPDKEADYATEAPDCDGTVGASTVHRNNRGFSLIDGSRSPDFFGSAF